MSDSEDWPTSEDEDEQAPAAAALSPEPNAQQAEGDDEEDKEDEEGKEDEEEEEEEKAVVPPRVLAYIPVQMSLVGTQHLSVAGATVMHDAAREFFSVSFIDQQRRPLVHDVAAYSVAAVAAAKKKSSVLWEDELVPFSVSFEDAAADAPFLRYQDGKKRRWRLQFMTRAASVRFLVLALAVERIVRDACGRPLKAPPVRDIPAANPGKKAKSKAFAQVRAAVWAVPVGVRPADIDALASDALVPQAFDVAGPGLKQTTEAAEDVKVRDAVRDAEPSLLGQAVAKMRVGTARVMLVGRTAALLNDLREYGVAVPAPAAHTAYAVALVLAGVSKKRSGKKKKKRKEEDGRAAEAEPSAAVALGADAADPSREQPQPSEEKDNEQENEQQSGDAATALAPATSAPPPPTGQDDADDDADDGGGDDNAPVDLFNALKELRAVVRALPDTQTKVLKRLLSGMYEEAAEALEEDALAALRGVMVPVVARHAEANARDDVPGTISSVTAAMEAALERYSEEKQGETTADAAEVQALKDRVAALEAKNKKLSSENNQLGRKQIELATANIEMEDEDEEEAERASQGDGGGGGVKRKRLTEREEDDILLAEELEEVPSVPMHLDKQPSLIKNGTMRDYQLAGLNWLIALHTRGLGGVLADEMGLGKTLQTISLLAYLKQFRGIDGKHLVIVPLSTLGNWCRELERWCPALDVLRFHGNKDERNALVESRLKPRLFGVCVTSYEMCIMAKSAFQKVDWDCLIVDEAHRLKNEKSLLSQIVRLMPSRFRLLITGTPLQNNLHELWSLLNFIFPEKFADSEEFDNMFVNPEQQQPGDGGGGDGGSEESAEAFQQEAIKRLHSILRPVMLRRLKTDVEKRLLPKIETLLFVGMSKMQREVYKGVQHGNLDALLGKVKEKRKLLNVVMQLRKAANHPYLFDGVEDRKLDPYGDHLITNCGKLKVLDKLLPKLKADGSRVLIFSQMTRMLDILEDYCHIRAFQYCRIDGTTKTEDREEQMNIYNAPDSDKFLFLLSTRAGGLGINLATADIVILYDSDWNPQMDLQAQDRAHRIGQKKQVKVYRLVTEFTIEEKIVHRAEIKLRLDALVVQQGRLSNKQKNISQNDMLEMIRYGADKVFRSEDGDEITDQDIDLILQRGQQKTDEFNEKLRKHVGMKEFELKLDGGADKMDVEPAADADAEEDLLAVEALNQQAQTMAILESVTSSKRERRGPASYNADEYFRHALHQPSSHGRRSMRRPHRVPKMEPWQFYPRERVLELITKEEKFYHAHADDAIPPRTSGLTPEEDQELEQLLQQGFPTWRKRDFYAFRGACAEFGRTNIERIAENVVGKEPDDVRRYHEVFWQRYKELPNWQRNIEQFVSRGEARLAKRKELVDALEQFVPEEISLEELMDRITLNYTHNHKDKGFTVQADVFMLWRLRKLGYGSWEQLRRALRREPRFFGNFFLKSRTAADLERRVDSLLRILLKTYKRTHDGAGGGSAKKRRRTTSSKKK